MSGTGTYARDELLRQTRQQSIEYRQRVTEEYHLGHKISKKGLDQVEIQVGGNYGNCIYTNKAGANMIYRDAEVTEKQKKVGSHSVGLDTFEIIRLIVGKLEAAGQPARVF